MGGGPGGWGGLAAPHGSPPWPQELQLRWQEYRELVLLLLQWVRHHTAAFEERRFPSSFEEIEVGLASRPRAWPRAAQAGSWTHASPQILWCQFLKFKETELPAKEADKNRSKGIFQSLEVRGCPGRGERGQCWWEGGPLQQGGQGLVAELFQGGQAGGPWGARPLPP